MRTDATSRQKVCEWCRQPKFGESRCICDGPKFTLMAACDGCGEWADVDRLFSEDWDSDEEYCNDCYVGADTDQEGNDAEM